MSTKSPYSDTDTSSLSERLSILDDILYQLSTDTREETEGQFEQAEALADNAYTVLSQIQELVPPEQQADVLAEYLRESGFSSDVVTQMLGVPKDAVNMALAEAGYSPTGLSLTAPVQPGSNIPTLSGSAPSTSANPVQTAIDAVTSLPPVEALTDAAKAAGTEVGKVIDKIFQSIGLRPPTKIIGNPQPGATVVWGQTGGSPVVYTGTTPAGTQTGVTTGLPWLDAVVNRGIQVATGQSQIPDAGQISTVVIQEAIRDALGLPPGTDMSQVTDAAKQAVNAASSVFKYAEEDTEGGGRFDFDFDPKLPTDESGSAGLTPDGELDTSNLPDVKDPYDVVLGADGELKTTADPSVVVTDDQTPAALRGGVEARDALRGSVAPSFMGSVDVGGDVRGGLGSFISSDGIAGFDVRGEVNPYGYETKGSIRGEVNPYEVRDDVRDDVRGDVRGGSGFTIPQSFRAVTDTPGDLVDIDYLYDFSKGLDQPFLTTNEDDEVKNLSVFAEGGPTDAVDMVTRRPGQFGRNYFTPGRFEVTGTALGGEALDPTKIQIPEYEYVRDLLPEFGGPVLPTPAPSGAAPAPAPAPAPTPTPSGAAPVGATSDVLTGVETSPGTEDYTEGLATDASTQAAVAEALANTSPQMSFTTTQVQDPLKDYLISLGYGTGGKSITKEDVGSFRTQEDFSLDDIAAELGTTTDVLNQIYNFQPTAATTTVTPATGTSGITPLQSYLLNQGFGTARDITKADVTNFGASGFPLGDIANALGVTINDLNAIANYTPPTPSADQELYDFLEELGFVGTTRDVTQADIDAAELFLAQNPEYTVDDMAAMLGIEEGYAAGGMAMSSPNYLSGATDGMADLIPATIEGTQPAALSDGEFVIPADVVSHLGNGNSDAGAKQLYAMMDRVRSKRTGTTKQGPEIDPVKMMPK